MKNLNLVKIFIYPLTYHLNHFIITQLQKFEPMKKLTVEQKKDALNNSLRYFGFDEKYGNSWITTKDSAIYYIENY